MYRWLPLSLVTMLTLHACSTDGGVGGRGSSGGSPMHGGGAPDESAAGAPASGGAAVAAAGAEQAAGEPSVSAGAGGAAPLDDPSASRVTLQFPPPHCYTNASVVSLRGLAHDVDGIAHVAVNGQEASSSDGFASWHLDVAVAPGLNHFDISVEDRAGNVVAKAATVEIANRGEALVNPQGLAADGAGGLLITDFRGALFRLDLRSGELSVLSDDAHGSGPSFRPSRAVVMDALAGRALTFSWGDDVLLGVDLSSGDREVVSGTASADADIRFSSGLALDPAAGVAFAATQDAIVQIDLEDGSRSVISSATVGGGLDWTLPNDLAYDDVTNPAAPRLLVSDMEGRAVLAVDLATGDRSLFSSIARGSGLALQNPSRMQLDVEGARLLVVDGSIADSGRATYRYNRSALVAIDLQTGARTTLADPRDGKGATLNSPYGLVLDGRTAYWANDWGDGIAALDVITLKRKLVHDSSVGSGQRMIDPSGLSLWTSPEEGAASPELFVVDSLLKTVFRIDDASGERVVVSSQDVGEGAPFESPKDIAVVGGALRPERAYVLDARKNSLVELDLTTGARSLVSGPGVGSGPVLGSDDYASLQALALDVANSRAFVTNQGLGNAPAGVYEIDLVSGNRSLISSAARGDGPAFILLDGIVLDDATVPSAPRGLAISTTGVFSFDFETGNRTALSTFSVGEGTALFEPLRAVLDRGAKSLLTTDLHRGLIEVQLSNGARALRSGSNGSDTAGRGPRFDVPKGIQADFANRVAYVADATLGSIFAVDLTTGDRVFLSR